MACGAIAMYNDAEPPPGPRNLHLLFMRSVTIRGSRNNDFASLRGRFREAVTEALRTGAVRTRETIVDGIERFPEAFESVFAGAPAGKLLIRVGPDGRAVNVEGDEA